MPLISDITALLEAYAPLALQEDYDNCGLQVGDRSAECTGVLLVLDVTPAAVAEAAERGCNLIVSHHPLLFRGLKRVTGATQVERSVIEAVKRGIAIYSLHTAIDNAPGGVSYEMARRMGVEHTSTLAPRRHDLLKLSVFVPHDDAGKVSDALFRAGAGRLGNYDSCSYSVKGEGSFRPLEGSNPYVGHQGHIHFEPETRIEMLLPVWRRAAAERAIKESHPYECPAYEFVALENEAPQYGSGVIGTLPMPMTARELTALVKKSFGSPTVRCTRLPHGELRRVAMCGGSGSFLIADAIAAGADAFITSDTSYHNFVDYADAIFIIDIGHFESEECTKEIFYRIITEKFPNFAVHYSTTDKNPIIYL